MENYSSYNEKELLLEISLGNEISFAQLFHHWKDRVYSIALQITRSEMLAEELVQDVFLKLWINRELLPNVNSFEDYFFIVIRNTAFSALKKSAGRRNVIPIETENLSLADFSTEHTLNEKEFQSLIQQAVGQLPPQQKKVFQLIKQQGLSRKEAAEEMNISPESVKTHLEKAVRSVRAWCAARLGLYLVIIYEWWSKNNF